MNKFRKIMFYHIWYKCVILNMYCILIILIFLKWLDQVLYLSILHVIKLEFYIIMLGLMIVIYVTKHDKQDFA